MWMSSRQGSCKHIGALLADYSRLRTLSEYVTCTEMPNNGTYLDQDVSSQSQWKNLGVGVVSYSLQVYYETLGQKMEHDPCPIKYRAVDPNLLENLCCDLLQYEQKCAFTNILLLLTESIKRDHCYHCKSCEIPNSSPINEAISTSTPTRPQNGDKMMKLMQYQMRTSIL